MEILRQQLAQDIKDDYLRRANDGMFDNPYRNYPTQRYWTKDGGLFVPDGPWTKQNPKAPRPTPEETQGFIEQGLRVDDYGRPLHPYIDEMISNERIGVIGDTGYYWKYGPNQTGDPIVITEEEDPKMLLILRKDGGGWALAGGHVEHGETGVEAAAREGGEEAGIELDPDEGEVIYSGVVGDRRTTAHAWAHTTAVVWRIPKTVAVTPGDDAEAAGWFTRRGVAAVLLGTHAILANCVMSQLEG